MANLCTNASLDLTIVSHSTILGSTSSLFTYFFCVLFGLEHFLWAKLLAVLGTFLGVIFVSLSDVEPGSGQADAAVQTKIIGDVLALCGAIFYGFYTSRMKQTFGDDEEDDSAARDFPKLLAWIGLWNFCFMWPIALVLHWTGVESLAGLGAIFSSPAILGCLLANTLLGSVLSEFLWLVALQNLHSPITVTVGLSLMIPLSLLGDWIIMHEGNWNAFSVAGGILIFAGFIYLQWRDDRPPDS